MCGVKVYPCLKRDQGNTAVKILPKAQCPISHESQDKKQNKKDI